MTLGPQFDPKAFSNDFNTFLSETGMEVPYGRLIVAGRGFPAIGTGYSTHTRKVNEHTLEPERHLQTWLPHESGINTYVNMRTMPRTAHYGNVREITLATRPTATGPGAFATESFTDPEHLAEIIGRHHSEVDALFRSGVKADPYSLEQSSRVMDQFRKTDPDEPTVGHWSSSLNGVHDKNVSGRFSRNLEFRRTLL